MIGVTKSEEKRIEKEKSFMKLRGSRKAYLGIYVMILVLIGVLIYLKKNGLYINNYVFWGIIGFVVLGVKGTEIHRFRVYYEISTHYLIQSNGIFSKHLSQIHMPTISDIIIKQNLWQRILNYGDIDIHRFTVGPLLTIKRINNPSGFAELLEMRMDLGKGR